MKYLLAFALTLTGFITTVLSVTPFPTFSKDLEKINIEAKALLRVISAFPASGITNQQVTVLNQAMQGLSGIINEATTHADALTGATYFEVIGTAPQILDYALTIEVALTNLETRNSAFPTEAVGLVGNYVWSVGSSTSDFADALVSYATPAITWAADRFKSDTENAFDHIYKYFPHNS